MKVHFVSGLPRSGSTLLSALLRQNPRFDSGTSGPLAMLCGNLIHSMSGATEFASFFSDARRRAIVDGLFRSYHAESAPGTVVFDTNRTWTARLPLIADVFPSARVLCCVREIPWVLDSLERLVRRNPLQPSKLFGFKAGGSVYSRVEILMDPEKGLVGLAWSGLREAWFSEFAGKLILVQYESLAREPRRVMRRLYELLEQPSFEHDFKHVVFDAPAYDADLGLPGLHRVRSEVSFEDRAPCLPPDLFSKYANTAFWMNPNLNLRSVPVLLA